MNNNLAVSKQGGAMITAMLFSFITLAMVGSYLAYTSADSRMTARALDYQKAKIAAEAALEYGVIRLKEVILRDQLDFWTRPQLESILASVAPPAPMGDYLYQTPGGQPAFQISTASDVYNGAISNGTYQTMDGQYQYYTVRAGALNPKTGVGAVLRREVQGVGLFLIRFGVFYEEDLEILPGANMTLSGPVHCNGDLYVDSGATLRFTDRVTAHRDMYRTRKDRIETHAGSVRINNAAASEISMNIDSSTTSWMIDSISLWDARVLSGAHGVQHLSPPISPMDVPHDIVERPIAAGAPGYNAETEREKFANKASLTIKIRTNGTLVATDSRGVDVSSFFTNALLTTNGAYSGKPLWGKDSNNQYTMRKKGSYSIGNNFYDAREQKTMAPVDIYITSLTNAFSQVADSTYSVEEGRGVVYVTRDDPDGAGGVLPCVRIRNGLKLPAGGLTFASDLPLYVEGEYNTCSVQPALVTGDAVTFLSENWQDARSTAGLATRAPVNTTYNTVIMTGNTATVPGGGAANYNGGLENVLRFLEDWSGETVYYRGSIIDLWYSEKANAPWSYGSYYTAPVRNWGYDPIYRTRVPPGMTRVFGVEELSWKESTWENEGW
ncbi:MAG TPA: hypothetical protein DCZ95_17235 [Verrucomicrobia bacterium]|nr:MAG: hypothetical protein A2X46_09715 [Lentisphaerae bacterium GWF2_57_35]HBA85829.1 hypothetical protein [Verrucomicrobiota bacterium]